MICRRRLHRLRTRNMLALMVVTVLLIGVVLTYKTLNGQDTGPAYRSSLPTMEKRKPRPRYQAAHPNQHRLFSGDRQQARSRLDLQFNAGLRVAGVKEVLSILYPVTWSQAREPDEVAILLKDRLLGLDLHSPMSCQQINDLEILGSLGSSNRKYVEKLQEPQNAFGGGGGGGGGSNGEGSREQQDGDRPKRRSLMAVKSQASDVQTKIACMKQVYNADFCNTMGNYLLMREVFLLRYLQHPGLIRLLGYCLRGDHISMDLRKKGVVMVMEAGEPLLPSMLASLPWSRRVQVRRLFV